jgi:hypothetical protein
MGAELQFPPGHMLSDDRLNDGIGMKEAKPEDKYGAPSIEDVVDTNELIASIPIGKAERLIRAIVPPRRGSPIRSGWV